MKPLSVEYAAHRIGLEIVRRWTAAQIRKDLDSVERAVELVEFFALDPEALRSTIGLCIRESKMPAPPTAHNIIAVVDAMQANDLFYSKFCELMEHSLRSLEEEYAKPQPSAE